MSGCLMTVGGTEVAIDLTLIAIFPLYLRVPLRTAGTTAAGGATAAADPVPTRRPGTPGRVLTTGHVAVSAKRNSAVLSCDEGETSAL
ncbi:hypothetical protein GCM10027067_21800 [Pseudactinotalea suaedae]